MNTNNCEDIKDMDNKQNTPGMIDDRADNQRGTGEPVANPQVETRQQEIAALEAKLNALNEQYIDLNNKYNAMMASRSTAEQPAEAYPEKLPEDQIPEHIKQLKKQYLQ